MHTFLTPKPITIEIRNSSGEILLDLSDTATTTVDVTEHVGHPLAFVDEMVRAFGGRARGWRPGLDDDPATDPADSVLVEYREAPDGGTLVIDTDSVGGITRTAFTLRIGAPTGSSLRVKAHSADVTAVGTINRAEIKTASGDIRLADVTGDALAHTASGDITVGAAGAALDVRTASGDIELDSVAGPATVHTTSGTIRIAAGADEITARSVSGDITIGDITAGLTVVTTVTGNVEIGVHHGSTAAIDLTTLTGRTKSDFEVSDDQPAAGDPALQIKIKTTSGDIRLRRAVVSEVAA